MTSKEKLKEKIFEVLVKHGSYAESPWYGLGSFSLFDIGRKKFERREILRDELQPIIDDLHKLIK